MQIHNHFCTDDGSARSNEKRMNRVELLAVCCMLWSIVKTWESLIFCNSHGNDIAFPSDSARFFSAFEWPGRAVGGVGGLRYASTAASNDYSIRFIVW